MTERLRNLCKRSLFLVAIARGFRFGVEHYQRVRRLENWHRDRAEVFKTYLESHSLRKLQIGTQEHILRGWLNTDLLPVDGRVAFMDATKPFPFANETFDYIFWEHCIEHISFAEALSALRECHQVLKPGGRVRLATPNLNNILHLCSASRSGIEERYLRWYIDTFTPEFASYEPGFVVNNTFRLWGHQFIYDPSTLTIALNRAGFGGICWFAEGKSEDENLRDLELHGRRVGEEMSRVETMIAEAARPDAETPAGIADNG